MRSMKKKRLKETQPLLARSSPPGGRGRPRTHRYHGSRKGHGPQGGRGRCAGSRGRGSLWLLRFNSLTSKRTSLNLSREAERSPYDVLAAGAELFLRVIYPLFKAQDKGPLPLGFSPWPLLSMLTPRPKGTGIWWPPVPPAPPTGPPARQALRELLSDNPSPPFSKSMSLLQETVQIKTAEMCKNFQKKPLPFLAGC